MDLDPVILSDEELDVLRGATRRLADWVQGLVWSAVDEEGQLLGDVRDLEVERENILAARRFWYESRDYLTLWRFPGQVESRLSLGHCPIPALGGADGLPRMADGRVEEAWLHYKIADAFYYGGVDLFFLEIKADRLEGAVREYREAVALDPKNVEIRHGLLCVLSIQGLGRPGELLTEELEMLRINPNEAVTFHDSLDQVRRYYGNLDLHYVTEMLDGDERDEAVREALDALEKIVKADPNNEPAQRELATMRWVSEIRDGLGASMTDDRLAGIETREWATAGGDASRSGVSSLAIKPPLSLVWSFDQCAWIHGGIVVSGTTAVFGDDRGQLHAVDVKDARELWRHELTGILTGTPAIHEGKVYAGKSTSAVCLDLATGREIWRSDTGQGERSDPLEAAIGSMGCVLCLGHLVFMCDDHLKVFRAEDGRVIWDEPGAYEPYAHTSPCADDNHVYIPAYRQIFRLSVDSGRMDRMLRTNGKISAGPAVAGELLLYGSSRSTIEAVGLGEWESLWSFQVEDPLIFEGAGAAVESRPVLRGGRVFFGGPDGTVYALDAGTGEKIWAHRTAVLLEGPPLISGEACYILTGRGEFLALSTEDGRLLWKHGTGEDEPTSGLSCAPAVAGDRILVGWDKLYCLETQR